MQCDSAQNRGYIIKMMNKLHTLILMLLLGVPARTMHNDTHQLQPWFVNTYYQFFLSQYDNPRACRFQYLVNEYNRTDPNNTEALDLLYGQIIELLPARPLPRRDLLASFNAAAITQPRINVQSDSLDESVNNHQIDLMCNENPDDSLP